MSLVGKKVRTLIKDWEVVSSTLTRLITDRTMWQSVVHGKRCIFIRGLYGYCLTTYSPDLLVFYKPMKVQDIYKQRKFRVLKCEDDWDVVKQECIDKTFKISSVHFKKRVIGAWINDKIYHYFRWREVEII